MEGGKVAPGVLKIFEDTLYGLYKPGEKAANQPAEDVPEAARGMVGAIQFTTAALEWNSAKEAIWDVEDACKAAGIEAWHRRVVNARLDVSGCIIELMQVRDYSAMLELEKKLMAASEQMIKAVVELVEIARARRLDISRTQEVLEDALIGMLEARGMVNA